MVEKEIVVEEISEIDLIKYKSFFSEGLIKDEDKFRISINDEQDEPFPTRGYANSFTLGAYVNNELAGVVSFEREGAIREKLRHKGLLFRMYVSGNFRGRGIGKLLVSEVIERAKALGDIERINLTVIASNPTAIALYKKFDFKTFSIEEEAIKWNSRYLTENQMVLEIK